MSHGFDDELTRRVEDAFDLYLQERDSGRLRDTTGFVGAQPEELRARLAELIEQYQLLRSKLEEGPRGFRPGRVLGHYRLIRELGRGAMGMVFEAHDQVLDRRVAVKLLYPIYSLSESVLERFRREASAGGRLSHPGIVAVLEVGEDQDTHFIVQELVRGGSLEPRLEEWKRRREHSAEHFRQVAALFADIAEALGEAHAHGVVHRDVKPANVLLTAGGRPKVADFGLAWIEEEISHTGTGVTTGTPFYMSPEQADPRRGHIGPATDVFSLGVTLYEALTLTRPFEGDTRQQVAEKILQHEPADPRRLRSRIPRDLAVICLRSLEKAPGDRYANGAELAADLRRFLADQPIVARPPSRLQVAWKWCRRHKALASTAAVVLASLLVVSALSLRLRFALDENQEILDRTQPLLAVLGGGEAELETVRQLADYAHENLDAQAELQATWLAVLGRELARREELGPAVRALEVAWRHYEAAPERYAREGLGVATELARAYTSRGELASAEALLLALLAGWPLEEAGADELALKGELLSLYLRDPDPAERLAAFESSYGSAEEVLLALRTTREERYGAGSPRALEVWVDLARYLVAVERADEAQVTLESIQGRVGTSLPEDHRVTLAHMELLSALRVAAGEKSGGALLRRLIGIVEASGLRFAPHDNGMLHLRLGESDLRHRRAGEAVASFETALALAQDDGTRLASLRGAARGRLERAGAEDGARTVEALLHRALELPGLAPAQRVELLQLLAFARGSEEDWRGCIAACDEGLALADSESDARDELEQMKALALELSGRLEEARALQGRLCARLDARLGPWDDRRLVALRRFCTLHGERGRADVALAAIAAWRAAAGAPPEEDLEKRLWSACFDAYRAVLEDPATTDAWGEVSKLRNALHVGPEPSYVHSSMAEALSLARTQGHVKGELQKATFLLVPVSDVLYLHTGFLRLERAAAVRAFQAAARALKEAQEASATDEPK